MATIDISISDVASASDAVARAADSLRVVTDSAIVNELLEVVIGDSMEIVISDTLLASDRLGIVFDVGNIPFMATIERTEFLKANLTRTEVL